MNRRLRLDPDAGYFARRLVPSARIADHLLRETVETAGFTRLLEGRACVVVIHGVRPADAVTIHQAAQDITGGTPDDAFALDAMVLDWTDPKSLRPNHVERLLLEASTSTRPMVVLCRARSAVPPVVSAVADAMLPLAKREGAIRDFVAELAGFLPDDALMARLARLPLAYLNLLLRPGMSRDRMWSVAGRLGRHSFVEEDGKRNPKKEKEGGAARADRKASLAGDARPERLDDLPGMGEARRWGQALANDLVRYRAGTLPWADVEAGALLHGPPGTGKTLFARALAGSCGVPLHAHSFASWQSRGHLGDLLKAMRSAFEEARKTAPSILFLDELDSVGSRDEQLGDHASYQRQVVNGLLECLDGATARPGVVVVGATNNRDAIDAAVLRPGRLGRLIEVALPDRDGRAGILRHHLRGDLPGMDLLALADEIGEASGAALAQVVREARGSARRDGRALVAADLWNALPEGTLLSDAAFRRLCVHEAGHAVAGLELAAVSGLTPTRVAVRRRIRHADANRTDFRVVEGHDHARENVEAQVSVLLAGMAAEEVLLGSRGSGSGGTPEADLVRATRLAESIEFSLGLGEGLHSVPAGALSKAVAAAGGNPALRDRVERVLERCHREARSIVERRREEVEDLSRALAERSVVDLP
ncbi:AAA family ATPase [Aureimonas phyllosphaerae]|uniref:AAA family ATPase n=1 Tax=Aureimonas phyllosphaerae TaxID=1166078 RepID=UPI003A5C3D64